MKRTTALKSAAVLGVASPALAACGGSSTSTESSAAPAASSAAPMSSAPAASAAPAALDCKIGTMLPCNVVVQEHAPGKVEVSAIDPMESMKAVDNPALGAVATEVRDRLKRVIAAL